MYFKIYQLTIPSFENRTKQVNLVDNEVFIIHNDSIADIIRMDKEDKDQSFKHIPSASTKQEGKWEERWTETQKSAERVHSKYW